MGIKFFPQGGIQYIGGGGRDAISMGGGSSRYRIDFTSLSDGAFPGWVAPTWSVVANNAINTPALGSNLYTAGDMESGTGGFSASSGATLALIADPRTGSAGTQSLSVIRGTANLSALANTQALITLGNWYVLKTWLRSVTSTIGRVAIEGDSPLPTYTSSTWHQVSIAARGTSAGGRRIFLYSQATAGVDSHFDDLQLFNPAFVDLLGFAPPINATDAGVKVAFARLSGTTGTVTDTIGLFAGIATRWDNPTNPRNGLLFYYFDDDAIGESYRLDQCLNGVWSNLSKKAVTINLSNKPYIRTTGTTAYCYFGATLLDTVTIDASLSNNIYHGVFSVDPAIQFTNFSEQAHRVYRWSIIGDSQSVAGTWVDYLSNKYPGLPVMLNHATGGHSIMTNMDAQVAAAASDNADFVILALGTNDDNAGNMATLQAEVESNIAALKVSNPNAIIIYYNVLPRWTDSTGATPVDKSNIRTAIEAACAAQNVLCVSRFTWIVAGDTTDGLHPTQPGYEKIAVAALPTVPWIL